MPARCRSSSAPAPATTPSTSPPRRSAASTSRTARARTAIAVAELAFGLILALDRRIPDNVAELRAGKWNKKEYSKARACSARRSACSASATSARRWPARARAFGMPVVVWSRRFAARTAAARTRRPSRASASTVAGRPRRGAGGARPTSSACTWRWPGHAGASSTPTLLAHAEAGRLLHQHRARRGRRPRGARGRRPEKGLRVGLDVFANEPAGATGDFADPIWSRCPASTARTTSARPPTRRRRPSPPRPSASSAATRTPARCRTS